MAGLLDLFSTGNGLLNPKHQDAYRRQKFGEAIRSVGESLQALSMGRPAPQMQPGMSQEDMLRIQEHQRQKQAQDAQQGQWSETTGGLDPRTGIDWKTGRQGPGQPGTGLLGMAKARGMDPALMQGMLSAMGPQKGSAAMLEMSKPTEAFETVQDPYGRGGVGQRSTTSGQITGYQKPEPEPESYGEPQFDAALGKYYQTNPKTGKREYTSPQSGMEITTSDGTTIRTGVRTGGGLGKKTTGDIEGKLLGAREGLARVRDIASKFKPEYQEVFTRAGHAWSGLKARFGRDVSPEDQGTYTEFADYQRDAISNINLYIKEITGAQMGKDEATRLRLAVPDTGEGIFGGDDPIKFAAKMESTEDALEKAAVRYEHYLSQGLTDPERMARQTPLESMTVYVNPTTGEEIVEIDGQWIPMK